MMGRCVWEGGVGGMAGGGMRLLARHCCSSGCLGGEREGVCVRERERERQRESEGEQARD